MAEFLENYKKINDKHILRFQKLFFLVEEMMWTIIATSRTRYLKPYAQLMIAKASRLVLESCTPLSTRKQVLFNLQTFGEVLLKK